MRLTPSDRSPIIGAEVRPALAVGFIIASSLLVLAVPMRAQLCPGSHIYYVVRDANGNAVDAAAGTFTTGAAHRPDNVGGRDYSGFALLMPADLLDAVKSRIAPLRVASAYCNFNTKKQVTLRLTMSGAVQELTFQVPQLGASESRSFLVDGPRFQAGQFEITLTVTAPGQHLYYPATGWKKR